MNFLKDENNNLSNNIGDSVYYTDSRNKRFGTEVVYQNRVLTFGQSIKIKDEEAFYIPMEYRKFAYQTDDDIPGDVNFLKIDKNGVSEIGQCLYYREELVELVEKEIVIRFSQNLKDEEFVLVLKALGVDYEIKIK